MLNLKSSWILLCICGACAADELMFANPNLYLQTCKANQASHDTSASSLAQFVCVALKNPKLRGQLVDAQQKAEFTGWRATVTRDDSHANIVRFRSEGTLPRYRCQMTITDTEDKPIDDEAMAISCGYNK